MRLKRLRKSFIISCLVCMSFSLCSCIFDLNKNDNNESSKKDEEVKRYEAIYKQYQTFGGNLSYFEWESIVLANHVKLLANYGAPVYEIGSNDCAYFDYDSFNYYVKYDDLWQIEGTLRDENIPYICETDPDDSGDYEITIWCDYDLSNQTKNLIQEFIQNTSYDDGTPRYNITFHVESLSPVEVVPHVCTDVFRAADIFIFPQDQIPNLMATQALSFVPNKTGNYIRTENRQAAVNPITFNNQLYGYPVHNNGGYFLYYDKTLLSNDDVKDISTIFEKLDENDKKFGFNFTTSGYYTASFFAALGCESNWEVDEYEHFISCTDNYKTKGLKAMQALRDLKKYNNITHNEDPITLQSASGAVVSGTWNYKRGVKAIGNNLGVCEMPSFTVNDETFHMSSLNSYNYIGVKPQNSSKKLSVCHKIAQYLSSNKSQMSFFDVANTAPTNLLSLKKDTVLAHPAFKALMDQEPYSQPFTIKPALWFSLVTALVSKIHVGDNDVQLMSYLNDYEASLSELLADQ